MSANLKKRQSMILGIIVAFMMIGAGLFAGCTSNNTNFSDETPVFSDNSLTVIDTAYNEYDVLRQNMSANDARQQLIQKISNEYEGVENAHLGIDNSSIFIEFSDGGGAIVDTHEYNESYDVIPESGFMGTGGTPNNDYRSTNTLRFDDFSIQPLETGYSSRVGETFESTYQLSFDATQEKITSNKKKVLILAPCYYEFPTKPWDDTVDWFKAYGWTDDDIDIKVVDGNEWKSTVRGGNIIPEDYFNLEDYGIILFEGHGSADKNHDEDNLYLQFCFVSNKTLQENATLKKTLKELYYEKKIFTSKSLYGFDGTTPVCWIGTYIRADYLREKMDTTLPGSYVYFSTCFGGYFNHIFLDKGAKVFLGYNRGVRYDISDENMLAMNTLLLEKSYSAHTAFLDETVIKKSIFEDKEVQLNIYPDPDINPTVDTYYFPAWFDKITVTGIPEEADSIDVTMTSDTNISMKSKNYPVSSSTLTVTDFNDFVFPATVTRTIHVNALDASKEVLADGQSTFNLSAGANSLQINLTEKEDKEEREYVEYSYYGHTNVSVDFSVSSNSWKTGKEVTATATCTNSDPRGVEQFKFSFHNCNVTILAYDPSFQTNSSTGRSYGLITNGSLGSLPRIEWSSAPGIGWGSPATFTVRFRLNSRSAGYASYIQAHCWPIEHEVYSCPQINFI